MAKQILHQTWRDLQQASETGGMVRPAVIEVHAKLGKRRRAELIAQLYAGSGPPRGVFPRLEGQLVTWSPA
jgi:phage terminase large subunit-like protein